MSTAYGLHFIYDLAIQEFESADPNGMVRDSALQIVWPIRLREQAQLTRKLSNLLLAIMNNGEIWERIEASDPDIKEELLTVFQARSRS